MSSSRAIAWAHIRRHPSSNIALCGSDIAHNEFAFENAERAVKVYASAGIPPRPCDSCLEAIPDSAKQAPITWGGGAARDPKTI